MWIGDRGGRPKAAADNEAGDDDEEEDSGDEIPKPVKYAMEKHDLKADLCMN